MTRAILLGILLVALVSVQAQDMPENSCTEATACQNNNVEELSIGGLSCNEVDSCSNNSGKKLSVGSGACNSAKAISSAAWVGPQGGSGTCSHNSGDIQIGNLGCTGPGSCTYNVVKKVLVGQRACSGDVSCSDNTAQVDANDDGCTGHGSCSQNGPRESDPAPPERTILQVQAGCAGEGSCRNGKGNARFLGCGGKDSCTEWTVDYATGANINDLKTAFTVNAGSCSGDGSCQKVSGMSVTILEESCTGANSCKDISASGTAITIGKNACTEDNSCQGCSGDIPDGACKCDGGKCKSGGSSSSSGSSSSGSSSASGGDAASSKANCLGRRLATALVLLVGFLGI